MSHAQDKGARASLDSSKEHFQLAVPVRSDQPRLFFIQMRLRANERCPIHGRYDCCGRQSRFSARSERSKAVQKVDDPHHPLGYREICSRAELRRRKHVLLSKDPTCWLAEKSLTTTARLNLSIRSPKAWTEQGATITGTTRSNTPHKQCNFEKGSKRIPGFLA